MKLIKYFVEFILVIIFFLILKLLGVRKSSNFSCFIFKKIGPLIRSFKKIRKNIKIVFPEINETQIKEISLKMWCNYGRTFAEYMHLKYFRENKNNNIKIINPEKISKLKSINKPILFFSGHFANFELLAMYLDKNGFDISALYRPLNNIFLNPVMEYLRRKFICKKQIPKTIPGKKKYKYGARELISRIKNGENIALMVDQKVTQGLKIDFFNKKALTMNLPAQMALKYNYLLQPLSIKRLNDIDFEIYFHETIVINSHDDEYSVTKKINEELESMISKNSYQWIWTHDRWRI